MEKLTKKTALMECLEVWSQLAKSGDDDKPAYAENFENRCPCCEYVCQQDPMQRDAIKCGSDMPERNDRYSLNLCPLSSLWPNGCCVDGSPYVRWQMGGTEEERKQAAQEIVHGCEIELSEIKREEIEHETE